METVGRIKCLDLDLDFQSCDFRPVHSETAMFGLGDLQREVPVKIRDTSPGRSQTSQSQGLIQCSTIPPPPKKKKLF